MSGRQLIVLSLVALTIGLLALLAQKEQGAQHAPQARTRLYPELESRLKEVTAIAIVPPGGPAIHVERAGREWKVRERDGYPADITRIRETLVRLARLETLEPKTRVPERYARLGVGAPDQTEGGGTEVRLMNKDGRVLADLIVGESADGGGYVRPQGEAQSWLVSEHIVLSPRPQDWLEKALLRTPLERIVQVVRHPPEGPAFTVRREAGEASAEGLVLAPVPPGRRPRPRELRRLASALSELSLTDVHSQSTDTVEDRPWDLSIYTTGEGLVVEAHTRTEDHKSYLRLSARLDASAGAAAEARARVEDEVTRLQRRFRGWTYEIPSYKASSLTLSLEALTEPEPQKPEHSSAPAPGAQASGSEAPARGPGAPTDSIPAPKPRADPQSAVRMAPPTAPPASPGPSAGHKPEPSVPQ